MRQASFGVVEARPCGHGRHFRMDCGGCVGLVARLPVCKCRRGLVLPAAAVCVLCDLEDEKRHAATVRSLGGAA